MVAVLSGEHVDQLAMINIISEIIIYSGSCKYREFYKLPSNRNITQEIRTVIGDSSCWE